METEYAKNAAKEGRQTHTYIRMEYLCGYDVSCCCTMAMMMMTITTIGGITCGYFFLLLFHQFLFFCSSSFRSRNSTEFHIDANETKQLRSRATEHVLLSGPTWTCKHFITTRMHRTYDIIPTHSLIFLLSLAQRHVVRVASIYVGLMCFGRSQR